MDGWIRRMQPLHNSQLRPLKSQLDGCQSLNISNPIADSHFGLIVRTVLQSPNYLQFRLYRHIHTVKNTIARPTSMRTTTEIAGKITIMNNNAGYTWTRTKVDVKAVFKFFIHLIGTTAQDNAQPRQD